jgi:urea transport system permease protein
MAGIARRGVGVVVLLLGLGGLLVPAAGAADESGTPGSGSLQPTSPIEHALVELQSEDAEVRSQAVEVLIQQGDASLIPRLDEIREEASRAVRIAIKPVVDLLKNRANLTSDSPDTRRSAAADLGRGGRAEANP